MGFPVKLLISSDSYQKYLNKSLHHISGCITIKQGVTLKQIDGCRLSHMNTWWKKYQVKTKFIEHSEIYNMPHRNNIFSNMYSIYH